MNGEPIELRDFLDHHIDRYARWRERYAGLFARLLSKALPFNFRAIEQDEVMGIFSDFGGGSNPSDPLFTGSMRACKTMEFVPAWIGFGLT